MLLFHLFLGFFSSFLFSLCQSCQFVEEVSVCMHGNFSSSPHSSSSFSCSRRRNCAHVSYLSVHCTSSLAVVRKRIEPFLSERTTRYGIHKTFAIVRMLASTFFSCSTFTRVASNSAPKIGRSLWFICLLLEILASFLYWKFHMTKCNFFISLPWFLCADSLTK